MEKQIDVVLTKGELEIIQQALIEIVEVIYAEGIWEKPASVSVRDLEARISYILAIFDDEPEAE